MATLSQIGKFLAGCPLYDPETPDSGLPKELYIEKNIKPTITACCEAILDRPQTSRDTFLDIFERTWVRPKLKKEIARDITKSAVRCIINLHALLNRTLPIATYVDVKTHGISASIDLLYKTGEETYIGLFCFQDGEISYQASVDYSYRMQAAARAYNAKHDEKVATATTLFLMTGDTAAFAYDERDQIEAVAQAINSGVHIRRKCFQCKSCRNKEMCTVYI